MLGAQPSRWSEKRQGHGTNTASCLVGIEIHRLQALTKKLSRTLAIV
jgi:hypothetical protein